MGVSDVSKQTTISQLIDNAAKTTSNRNKGELGKDDFLNLLITQLRYQDPMKPVDDKEFIGQMAQFSALEQMQNLNTTFSSVKAYNLIGKYITGSLKDEKTGESKAIEGTVESIKVSSGKTYVMVDGEQVPVENVTNVTEAAKAAERKSLSEYTGLIGLNVNGALYDSQSGNIVGINGTVKSLYQGRNENYAVVDGVNVEIADIITDTTSTDPNFKKDYLSKNVGKEVSVVVIDRANNQRVPVKATLNNYSIDEDTGKISGVLDKVYVSVDSVSSISPVNQSDSK